MDRRLEKTDLMPVPNAAGADPLDRGALFGCLGLEALGFRFFLDLPFWLFIVTVVMYGIHRTTRQTVHHVTTR